MSPKISVIIPAHNEENYIKKTLHSLKEQTFQNFETIVVSNGCTDKTEEIVNKRVNEKLTHISISKANVCLARNKGAEKAQGEILVFVDADTLLEQDALQKINHQFTDKYVVGTTKTSPDNKKLKFQLALGFKNFYNYYGLYDGCSGVLICNKKSFDATGGYDDHVIIKEHRKLTLKLKKESGKKFCCVNTKATTSMRRFKKWGLIKASWFWIYQWGKDNFGDLKDSKYEKIR